VPLVAGSRATQSRRAFLAGSLSICPLVKATAVDGTALNIVVTGGHPGDPEYGCGGTIARYTQRGHRVTLVYLNRGEDPHGGRAGCAAAANHATPRVHEAREACRLLGATPMFAGQCNSDAIVDNAHYAKFAELLARLKPDVIFTQWPIDNHPDHRAISNLTLEAWNRGGRTAAFYFYEVSDGADTLMFAPTDYVDITETEPLKRQACYAHASQQPDYFYALQSRISAFRGIEAGCRQAESYIRHVRSRPGFLP
jgi:LmbE family N-acetylglucosaminyl deacetylase